MAAIGVGSNQNLHHERRHKASGSNETEANIREIEFILQVAHKSEDDTSAGFHCKNRAK
jgi:hypothetical protein